MAKPRSGYIFQDKQNKWYARITLTDSNGKRRNIKRRACDKSEAKHILRQLIRQIEDEGEKAIESSDVTFAELCDFYERVYLRPATYAGERKVSGLRDLDRPLRALKLFRAHFGSKKLRNFTYGDIYAYRDARIKVKTIHGRQRSIAAMNRELVVLRRLFNVALQQGWILKNPFKSGDSLISLASENKRERVLSFDEERQLLAAIAIEPKREHLKGILIIALDCALRRNEILTLTWQDVDFDQRTLTIRAFNAKTAKSRKVAMTKRIYVDLTTRWLASDQNTQAKIFDLKTIRTSFVKACKAANIKDFHLHDGRHTAITRMIRAGMPPVEVMRISGHTTMSAFYRYANLDSDTIFRAAALLDAFNDQPQTEPLKPAPPTAPELIN